MATGTTKKRMTPSAKRRKKSQQRIRKKAQTKVKKTQPNWKATMKKSYGSGKSGKGTAPYDPRVAKHMKKGSFVNPETGDEVQEEIDEEKMKRMNEVNPLETQLFLKHLPFDITEDEILTYLRRFGDVKRVFLVRSRATGALSGTGFVHCGTVELADSIIKFATQNARELSAAGREDMKSKTADMSHHQAKKLQFKLRTDSSEVRDPFIELKNTRVTVHKVLSRSDSQEVTSAAEKKRKRTRVAADDPRNLYLLQEGLITPESPAAKGLPERYVASLVADYESRRAMLKNTNYFVSKHRLNIRNLPKKLDDVAVRKIFLEHARAYLTKHPEDVDKEHWGKYGPVKNVKLLRDGNGASKGYAFVEFVNHNVALAVLRSLNNNPNVFGDAHRPVVSFAVESTNAIQKLQRLRELRQNRVVNRDGDEETHQ
eukprot:CAMPEP_0176436158 /NCGR_PEP_ID=MMETSP0127-20121128/17785_1 /TAXON_ID=938130 /ORGANISM="Platyophrya macrostoma, Strain WH" /LENGTH=427 /DNA_ID=CAMNT_0017819391 /DNA_START=84 /DNA_END=1367 /DNA_ORIENTATION=+